MKRQLPNDPIPAPADSAPRDVILLFGLAVYAGQALELNLANLALALQLATSPGRALNITVLDSRTLGQLLSIAREVGPLSQELDANLAAAVSRRNDLVHRFFVERAGMLHSATARRTMIEELKATVTLFNQVASDVTSLSDSFLVRFNIDPKEIDQRVDALIAKWAES